MPKQHLPVPKNGDVGQWWGFINSEIPLIEDTSDERGLQRFRNKAAQAVARLERTAHVAPVNPARYEGGMGDFAQFVFEHQQVGRKPD